MGFDSKPLNVPSSTRARAEAEMNKNLKKMLSTGVPDIISLASFITDWFHVNKKETTYSEGGKQSTDIKSYKFDLIEGQPAYNVPQRAEVDDTREDRKISIRGEDGTLYLAASQMRPNEMDHFYSYSHSDINHLFVVTQVRRIFLIDRDYWEVKYMPSPHFTYESIQSQLVNQYVYKEQSIQSGNGESASNIVPKSGAAAQDSLEKAIIGLNSSYIDTFYSEKYDALGFFPEIYLAALNPQEVVGYELKPEWMLLYLKRKMGFIYYALMDLQSRDAIMHYGLDRNILFLEPPYVLDGAKASINGSIYEKLIKKEFREIGTVGPTVNPFKNVNTDDTEYVQNASAYAFKYFEVIRDRLNFKYELKDYNVKYDYSVMFNFKLYEKHSALTRFWNSGIALNYLLHHTYFTDTYEKSACVKYTMKNNIVTKFCDMFMDKDFKGIVENLNLLDYYVLDKNSIDDYIGVPMLLLVLRETNNILLTKGL